MNQVTIITNRCKGCGMCFDNCPKHVFDHPYLGAKATAARVEDCIGCGICQLKCPDFAIVVEKESK